MRAERLIVRQRITPSPNTHICSDTQYALHCCVCVFNKGVFVLEVNSDEKWLQFLTYIRMYIQTCVQAFLIFNVNSIWLTVPHTNLQKRDWGCIVCMTWSLPCHIRIPPSHFLVSFTTTGTQLPNTLTTLAYLRTYIQHACSTYSRYKVTREFSLQSAWAR